MLEGGDNEEEEPIIITKNENTQYMLTQEDNDKETLLGPDIEKVDQPGKNKILDDSDIKHHIKDASRQCVVLSSNSDETHKNNITKTDKSGLGESSETFTSNSDTLDDQSFREGEDPNANSWCGIKMKRNFGI